MSRAELINDMVSRGIPVSPFMHYWTLEELTRYHASHP